MPNTLKKYLGPPIIFWTLSMLANFFNWLYSLRAGRLLAKEDFAVLSVFLTFQFLLTIPAHALGTTVSRFTSYYLEKGEDLRFYYFFRQYWWLAWTFGLAFFSSFILGQNFLIRFFNLTPELVLLFSVFILPFFLLAFETGVLLGRFAFAWVGTLFLVESAIKFGTFFWGKNLTAALVALPISGILTWFLSLLLGRSFRLAAGTYSGRYSFSDSYRFLGGSVFNSLGMVLIFSLDVLLVNHFFPAYIAGLYAALALMGKILYFSTASLAGLVVPYTARDLASHAETNGYFRLAFSAVGLVGLAILAAYWVFPDFLVTLLLGEEGLKVAAFLPKYSLAIFFLSLSSCLTNLCLAKKNYLQAQLMTLFALAELLGLTLFHQSLNAVVNVVLAVMAGLFLTLTFSYLIGLTGRAVLNNLASFLKLFGAGKQENAKVKSKGVRVLILSWRDRRHRLAGGAEVYLDEFARRLAARGIGVTIFSANDGSLPDNERRNKVSIIRRGGFITVYFWALLYCLFKFKGKFDLIIDCENGVPFLSPLFSVKPVILLVHHVHQDVFLKSLAPPFSWLAFGVETFLVPVVYRNCPVVAVSGSTANEVKNNLKLPVSEIIFNGVDTNAFSPAKKTDFPVICYLGRLKEYKGIEFLLAAFAKVYRSIPTARLWIVGAGDWREVLESKVKEMKTAGAVTFLGRVSEAEKVRILARSWVMVQPSFKEGWGLTCLEANACGTPVLASRVAGLREVVSEGENGFLFHYGDTEDLYWKILTVLNNPELRQKLNAQSRVWASRFSWDDQVRKWEHLLKGVCQGKSALVGGGIWVKPASPSA